jgi:hypothetical protein
VPRGELDGSAGAAVPVWRWVPPSSPRHHTASLPSLRCSPCPCMGPTRPTEWLAVCPGFGPEGVLPRLIRLGSMRRRRTGGDLVADVTSGVVGVAVAATPAGPFGGAIAAAAAGRGVRRVLDQLGVMGRRRPAHVLALAAQQAGVPVEQLHERLAQVPGGEELLIRTLMAAAGTPAEDRLVALSLALVHAVTEGTETEVTFESQFVAAVSDLGEAHWRVLQSFMLSQVEVDGLAYAKTQGEIDEGQLEVTLPWVVGLVDPLMPGLERHGLIELVQPEARSTLGPPRPRGRRRTWRMTPFGNQALERLRGVGALLAADPD